MNQELNIPYNEELARDVIAALQGHLFKPDFDPKTISLEQVLAPLDARIGVRMYSVTEGPGKHQAEISFGGGRRIPQKEYDVPQGKVYVTIDTIAFLAGSCATYMFAREEDGLKLEGQDTHMMS